MGNDSPYDRQKALRSAGYAALVHAALPVGLVPFCLFIVPHFAALFSQIGSELPASLRLFLRLTDFLSRYWLLYLVALAGVMIADGVICFLLFRSKRLAGHLWSWLVVFIEAGLAGYCLLILAPRT